MSAEFLDREGFTSKIHKIVFVEFLDRKGSDNFVAMFMNVAISPAKYIYVYFQGGPIVAFLKRGYRSSHIYI